MELNLPTVRGLRKKIKKERNVQKFITAILTAVLSEAQTRIRTG